MKNLKIVLLIIFGLSISANSQSLSLDSCKYYALENNRKIKEANLHLEAADQIKKQAFTKYFPNISAGAFAMKANKSLIEVELPEMNLPVYDGNPANLPTATMFTYFPGMSLELLDYTNAAMVSAVMPLYMGGRVRHGNQLASLGEDVSKLQLKLTKDEVIMATEYYYWSLLSLEEKLKTLDNHKRLLESIEKDVNISYESGLVNKSDVLKVKLELNSLNATRLKLENGISLLKMTLAQHIGIEYKETMSLADTIIEVSPPLQAYVKPEESLENRSEYKLLNKSLEAEVLQKKMAIGEYMPSLAVGVQGLYLDVFEKQNSYGLAFATISVPLSGWWEGSHKIQEHKIKVKIAENNLEEKSELLLLQMDKSYRDLNESYEQVKISEETIEQAKEHHNSIKNNFDAGVIGTSDMLEADALLQKAQDDFVDSKVAYKIKLVEYYKTSGQIIE